MIGHGSLIAAAMLVGCILTVPKSTAAVLEVSPFGQDLSSCGSVSITVQPCKTLQYTLDKAAAGDSLVLDLVGDYGPAVITKAVHIRGVEGAGVYAPAGVPCFKIDAGVNDLVSITGVTCDQAGAAKDGVLFNSGHRLRLVDLTLRRGGGGSCGVRFQPNGNAEFDFSGVRASNWGVAAGCVVPRSGADVRGVIKNANLQDNTYGLLLAPGAGSVVEVSCDDCRIAGGTVGAYSNGLDSTLRLRGNLISNNGTGLNHPNNGKIVSNGGNSIIGNTTNGTFTATEPQS